MAISDKQKVLMLQDAMDVMLDDMKALCDYAKELEGYAKDVAVDVDTDQGSECAIENKLYRIMLLKTCIAKKPNCMEMYHPKN
jgi:hypothetical protein